MPADELHSDRPGRSSYRFTHADATMVVEEEASGTPVFVLLHGLGMGRAVFGDLAPRLAEIGRVMAVDMPGYAEAPEPKRTLSMQEGGDMVAALLRHKGVPGAILVGHSMGTQIAVEAAARHPDLVQGVVLIAPTVDASARSARAQFVRLVRDLWGESPKVLITGGREYVRSWPNFFREMRAVIDHAPEDIYPRVTCAALVLRGENDRVSPREWCDTVVSLLPHAQFAEITDRSHETMIRDAAAVADHVSRFAASL
jgi:pimeloyl-ACP methyl ester carboxylesterase